jgi:hypothetical protein
MEWKEGAAGSVRFDSILTVLEGARGFVSVGAGPALSLDDYSSIRKGFTFDCSNLIQGATTFLFHVLGLNLQGQSPIPLALTFFFFEQLSMLHYVGAKMCVLALLLGHGSE